MSSDSSSDEENLNLLKEAADYEFINDNMFQKQKKPDFKTTKQQQLPSLRNTVEKDEFNLFKLTPEFRNHVAKHLSHLLDEKVNNLCTNCNTIRKKRRKFKGGIKLFNNSNEFITLDEKEPSKPKKKIKIVEENMEEKLQNVAITMEDIEKEVKSWSNRSKAPIFKYKQTANGIFEQIQ